MDRTEIVTITNMCICSTYYVLPSTIYFIIVMENGAVNFMFIELRKSKFGGVTWIGQKLLQ